MRGYLGNQGRNRPGKRNRGGGPDGNRGPRQDELPPDDLAWEGNDDTPVEVKAVRGNTALADIRAMLKR